MDALVLVRHALAGSNRDGIASCSAPGEGLTPEGVDQARRLGEVLARQVISLAVGTELARTRETLELALGGRDVQLLVVAELNEIDFGAFEGGPLDEYRAWAATHSPAEPPPGGGESRADAAARYARGLRLLLERSEAVVLHVGHALAIRYAMDAAQGLAPASLVASVEHSVPSTLTAQEVESAAACLQAWSRAPRFREHSNEGRVGRPAIRRP